MNTRVLVARKEKGFTQAELATKADLNQVDISRIEKAGWIPPEEIRQRLAAALDTTPDALFEGTEKVAS